MFTQNRTVGKRQYEIKDHLGNVRVVFSDKRITTSTNTNELEILSWTDYYPFGMALTGRKYTSESYRYGFNGMEKDDDLKGDGNSYDFGARLYDPRLGRWLSRDPLEHKYVNLSPYNFVDNSPIIFIDVDGRDFGVKTTNTDEGVLVTIKANIYAGVSPDENFKIDVRTAIDFYNDMVSGETYEQDGVKYTLKFELNFVNENKKMTQGEAKSAAESDPIGASIIHYKRLSLPDPDANGITEKSKYVKLEPSGLGNNGQIFNDIELNIIHEISHLFTSGVDGDAEKNQGHTEPRSFSYGYAKKVDKEKNVTNTWGMDTSPEFVKNLLKTAEVVDTGVEFTGNKSPKVVQLNDE